VEIIALIAAIVTILVGISALVKYIRKKGDPPSATSNQTTQSGDNLNITGNVYMNLGENFDHKNMQEIISSAARKYLEREFSQLHEKIDDYVNLIKSSPNRETLRNAVATVSGMAAKETQHSNARDIEGSIWGTANTTPEDSQTYELEFNTWRSIYPLFIWNTIKGSDQPPIHYAGTGFFVIIEGFLTLITAGHVMLDRDATKGERLVLSERIGNTGKLHVLEGIPIWKGSEDFSAFIVSQSFVDGLQGPVIALDVHREFLKPLEDVFTFGFPFNVVEKAFADALTTQEAFQIELNHMHLKGYITSDPKAQSLPPKMRPFSINYQLDIPSYPGLSGAPLLTVKNKRVEVAGILYASRRLTQGGTTGDFAVASTHEPIVELENIIKDGKASGRIH